jgi:uncharacterized membrane protein YdbT with pleckstrin-like domain
MSYVDSQLLPGEVVKYRAHLHKIMFFWVYLLGLFTVIGIIMAARNRDLLPLAAILLVITIISVIYARVIYSSSEFAVTDRRVIVKVGFIQRRTVETMLAKIEGIGVDQGLAGRILGYGTITVTGTGGTDEAFHQVADPLELRKQVQGQIMALDERRGSGQIAADPNRVERECPFCAERILVNAKICRFCGREV